MLRNRLIPISAGLVLLLAPLPARADYLALSDGRLLKVKRARFEAGYVEAHLAAGGMIRFDSKGVRYLTSDSDVEQPEPAVELAALVPAPPARAAQAPLPRWFQWEGSRYHAPILEAAGRHGVDSALVAAVIKAESDFMPHAVSPKGAQGLMQLMPAVAREYAVSDPFEPSQNIEAGVKLLKGLLDRYPGEPRLALAAYNAGPATVKRYGGVPPYRETTRYVDRVLDLWQQAR